MTLRQSEMKYESSFMSCVFGEASTFVKEEEEEEEEKGGRGLIRRVWEQEEGVLITERPEFFIMIISVWCVWEATCEGEEEESCASKADNWDSSYI